MYLYWNPVYVYFLICSRVNRNTGLMTNVYSKERHQVVIYRLNYNGFTLYTHNAIQVAVYNGFVDDS